MGPRRPVEMQEAVAFHAEGAAGLALDDGRRGAVVVVRADRQRLLRRAVGAPVPIQPTTIHATYKVIL